MSGRVETRELMSGRGQACDLIFLAWIFRLAMIELYEESSCFIVNYGFLGN